MHFYAMHVLVGIKNLFLVVAGFAVMATFKSSIILSFSIRLNVNYSFYDKYQCSGWRLTLFPIGLKNQVFHPFNFVLDWSSLFKMIKWFIFLNDIIV